ncbi:hypothetical protein [Pseudochrobactrum kiredjianiae]|uniref:Lipoprotein n=1 Tax=Pseudochrobactrum kiredjianiae TaxID=386305 RepID=A0ABW3V106_9HYPH|nr:hypothetical protein [Pseudochrobactrum kiredjianiae]MDM7852697.1 hypothetical protein [Pseudochrobactrum kiredjianiae]
MIMRLTAIVCLSLILASCASKSKDIKASYVSPTLYQNLSCSQLAGEAQSVSSRAATAAGVQDKNASNDAVRTTVGVVLFWPAVLFNNGDNAHAAELARLKGEMQAIEDAARRKNCKIQFKAK